MAQAAVTVTVNFPHINSSSLSEPLTLIFACLSLADYSSVIHVCHHWYDVSGRSTSWPNLNLHGLCSHLRGCQMKPHYITTHIHELQSFGRLIPAPSNEGELVSRHWSHGRYLKIGPPPLSLVLTEELSSYWSKEKVEQKQHTLVVNTLKTFIQAREQQRFNKLEGLQFTWTGDGFDGLRQLPPEVIQQFYLELTKLSQFELFITSMPVHPLVSELIHLKVLIVSDLPSLISIASLHQLEYLHLDQLQSEVVCYDIRHLSSAYALRTLSFHIATPQQIDQLCLSDPNQPVCGLTQLELKFWPVMKYPLMEYSNTIRKILLGLPHLTSFHGIQWISSELDLILPDLSGPTSIGDPRLNISTNQRIALAARLGALTSLSLSSRNYQSPYVNFTDLRLCTSLTSLDYNCLINHHQLQPMSQTIFKDLPHLKRLTLHTIIESNGFMGIDLMELIVLQELNHLQLTSTEKLGHYVWTDEVFEMLTKLPQFESYTINHFPHEVALEFSPRMLRAIIQSPTWVQLTILRELPPDISGYGRSGRTQSVSSEPDWIQSQTNLKTAIGSNIKWKYFRVKHLAHEYQLIPTPASATSMSSPISIQLQHQPSAQNYSWIRTSDIHHTLLSKLTYSTDHPRERCVIC